MEEKRVILEFVGGGPWDGRTYDSEAELEAERYLANRFFRETNGGTKGESICSIGAGDLLDISDEIELNGRELSEVIEERERKPIQDRYTVVEREETDSLVKVTFKHSRTK